MTKWNGFYLSLNIFIILLLFFFISPNYNLVHMINIVFYVSFFYLMVGLFLFTKRGGFYDGITVGFRRFKRIMGEEKDFIEDWKNEPLPSDKRNDRFYRIIKFQAIALLTLFIGLFVLYAI